jgi:hypothetical protein
MTRSPNLVRYRLTPRNMTNGLYTFHFSFPLPDKPIPLNCQWNASYHRYYNSTPYDWQQYSDLDISVILDIGDSESVDALVPQWQLGYQTDLPGFYVC